MLHTLVGMEIQVYVLGTNKVYLRVTVYKGLFVYIRTSDRMVTKKVMG